jgi:hypothetical protein
MVRRKDGGGVPMPDVSPVLVAGAGGDLGAVGRARWSSYGTGRCRSVRSYTARTGVPRLSALPVPRVVVGALTEAPDVLHTMTGCHRMYFAMSVSSRYLEATSPWRLPHARTETWQRWSTSRRTGRRTKSPTSSQITSGSSQGQ